jgi:hypothetical protein
MYTVMGARPGTELISFGTVLSADQDPSADGVQVRATGGVIQFVVDYPGGDGLATALAFSRDGTAKAIQTQPLRPQP